MTPAPTQIRQWSSRTTTIVTLALAGVFAIAIGIAAGTGHGGSSLGFDVQRETFTVSTSDGVQIVGTLRRPVAEPGTRYPVIVLVHDTGADHRAWESAETFFLREGYATLVFDRRGHGASTTQVIAGVSQPYDPRGSLEDELLDLTAVFAWIGGRTDVRTEDVRLVGAGSGATLAYRASGTYSQLVATVALDPTLGPDAVADAATTPFVQPITVFVVSGRDDAVARSLFDRVAEPRQLRMYQTDVRGVALLRSMTVRSDVLAWVNGTTETTDATP